MSVGLVSKKYLIDCANAIRLMLNSEDTYTLSQMATAISLIDGTISGSITKSSNTDSGLITDTLLDAICDALRIKLNDDSLSFTPAQIADAILSITSGGGSSAPDIVSFSSGTDDQISALIDYAHDNPDFDLHDDAGWSIGDKRTIRISQFTVDDTTNNAENMDIAISSFDDYNNCGCVLQFDFVDSLNSGYRLSSTNSNYGGYGATLMYSSILPALVNALPEWLKNRLITFDVLASEGMGSSNIDTIQNNKLSIRSEVEIKGTHSYSKEGEGSQIPYYTNSANIPKGRGKGSSAARYWTRSPYGNVGYFVTIEYGGGSDYYSPTSKYGLSAFGCL